MKLREWLYTRKIKITDFARLLNFNKSYIHMWFSGRRRPSRKTLDKVRDVTHGKVSTFKDLLDEK